MSEARAIATAAGILGVGLLEELARRPRVDVTESEQQPGYQTGQQVLRGELCGVWVAEPPTDFVRWADAWTEALNAAYDGLRDTDGHLYPESIPNRCLEQYGRRWIGAWRAAWEASPDNYRLYRREVAPNVGNEALAVEVGLAHPRSDPKAPYRTDLGDVVLPLVAILDDLRRLPGDEHDHVSTIEVISRVRLLAIRLDTRGWRPVDAVGEAWGELVDTITSPGSYVDAAGGVVSRVAGAVGGVLWSAAQALLFSDTVLLVGAAGVGVWLWRYR